MEVLPDEGHISIDGVEIEFRLIGPQPSQSPTIVMIHEGLGSVATWGDFPRRKVEAEYLNVLRFDDEIEIKLRVEKVGRTSVTYAWTIAKDGEAYIKGRHTVVHVDGEDRPEPLADELRAALDQ